MSLNIEETYKEVVKSLREIRQVEEIAHLLEWDEMVMLPSGSGGCRADQKEALAGILYDKQTNVKLGEHLRQLHEVKDELGAVRAANVRDSFKAFVRESAVPKDVAQRLAVLQSTAYEAWVDARKSADFSKFAPSLEEIVDINCKRAAYIDPAAPPYDVLLDMYENGMLSSRLDEVFAEVRAGLVPLIAEIKQKGTPPDASWLVRDYDVDVQAKLCKQIAIDLGFSTNMGRLDVSVHPFTTGHPQDVRITTRFKKEDLTEGITGTIHEAGHAMYEQGRNLGPEWKDLPVSCAMSMGIHESQSLLWERMVGLSRPFQSYLLPKIKEYFPDFPEVTTEAMYLAQNLIREPSLIRVEADEVTYTMHVILRYEIERGLIDRSIKVADVPALWNAKMQAYLGTTPPDDAVGCLQDIHWSGAAMGYFPTYTLGAMYAAQIYECARDNIPNLENSIAKGEFTPLRLWLNEKIHQVGSLHPNGDALMVAVTGKPLDPQVYLRYLRQKYTEIYKL